MMGAFAVQRKSSMLGGQNKQFVTKIVARKKDRSRMAGEDGAMLLQGSTELLHLEGPDYTVGLS